MKALALILLLATIPASAQELGSSRIRYWTESYVNDTHYVTEIREATFKKMPRWNPFDDTPPPVSPKRACQLAEKRVAAIRLPRLYTWVLDRISFIPLDGLDGKWIYNVSFVDVFQGDTVSGPRREQRIDFVVTMDGELIEPVVSPLVMGKKVSR